MWDNGGLSNGYEGRFDTYEELLGNGEPDIIYLNGAPEDELTDRVDWSLVHQRNLIDYSGTENEDTVFMGPKQEINLLEQKLGPENISATRPVEPQRNRLEEYKALSESIEGNEEIHFVTSDYCTNEDQILQQYALPNIQAEFIGAKTNHNTTTERLKRRLYAEALKISDKL